MVNSSGQVKASYEFAEYGQRISSSESGVSSQKTWVGGASVQDEVADTGLMMMGHRFYDPGLMGRFLNRDPIGFRGGLNLFEYAKSSPAFKIDPLGLTEYTGTVGPVTVVGSDLKMVNCIVKILKKISSTDPGIELFDQLHQRLKNGLTNEIRLGPNLEQIETLHTDGGMISIPEDPAAAYSHQMGLEAFFRDKGAVPFEASAMTVITDASSKYIKSSYLRIIAHELGHLASCPGGAKCGGNSPCRQEMAGTSVGWENKIMAAFNLSQRTEYPSTTTALYPHAIKDEYKNAPYEIVGEMEGC